MVVKILVHLGLYFSSKLEIDYVLRACSTNHLISSFRSFKYEKTKLTTYLVSLIHIVPPPSSLYLHLSLMHMNIQSFSLSSASRRGRKVTHFS